MTVGGVVDTAIIDGEDEAGGSGDSGLVGGRGDYGMGGVGELGGVQGEGPGLQPGLRQRGVPPSIATTTE